MLNSHWFLILVIVLLAGHAIAFIIYAVRVLMKDKPEIENEDAQGNSE